MNKRGQFYIIAALIIVAIVTTLIAEVNYARRQPKPIKFEDLSEDYEAEVTRIMDSCISRGYTPDEIKKEVDKFTAAFIEYAQQRNPDIQLLYIYGDSNDIHIVNYAQGDAKIDLPEDPTKSQSISGGGVVAESKVNIEVGGRTFSRSIEERMEHFKDIKTDISSPGAEVTVKFAGVVHDFDLTAYSKFYYVIQTQGTFEKREIYITREKPTEGI